ARALASVINLLDPDVIVLGGGMSNAERLYRNVPKLWGPYVYSDSVATPLVKARHGDASGVRGAARLWGVPAFRSVMMTSGTKLSAGRRSRVASPIPIGVPAPPLAPLLQRLDHVFDDFLRVAEHHHGLVHVEKRVVETRV